MDEAVAGHANWIEVELEGDGLSHRQRQRPRHPVDPHPKFKIQVGPRSDHDHAALGRQIRQQGLRIRPAACTASACRSSTPCRRMLEVEVARGQQLYAMTFARGEPQGKLKSLGAIKNRRGTRVRFKPDEKIFGKGATFKPARLLRMARSKAYLFGGVEFRWTCAKSLITDDTPEKATFHFPGGLKEYLEATINGQTRVTKVGSFSQAAPKKPTATARWNGRCAGWPTRTASSTPIAIPSRPPKAVRTRTGCAARSRRACAISASGWPTSVPPTSPPTTCWARRQPCSRCSSASPSSRARPRTSSPPRRRPASSRTQCAMRSTTGWRIAHSRRRGCSTGPSTRPRIASSASARRRSAARTRVASSDCPASSPTAP